MSSIIVNIGMTLNIQFNNINALLLQEKMTPLQIKNYVLFIYI